ncbi:HD domain-containing phosphohydrolase [Desulfobacula sp.]|uniref:HD domain-containing phosphohydrolase n=1 Tax=Desulfobacula sp. TaxID=2593537 RepID=UPI001EBE2336|nr:response regulator [Desulfobacula sp.]
MNSTNILIVDEDPVIRQMITQVIVSHHHMFKTAENGMEALDLIKKIDFDIVIADINIPILNGLELMAEVQKIKPETVFMILTGYSRDYSYERVIRAGAKDFIKKPFTIEELKNKLVRIIAERRMEEENKRLLTQQAELNVKLKAMLSVSSDLASELEFDSLFPLIISKITEIMAAERTSLYILDQDKQEIWTKVAECIDIIRLPLGEGISGRVAQTGELLNIADAWELPYFNKEFDRKNNFRTRSVLCLPIKNHGGEKVGVLQVINKKNKKRFDSRDEIFCKGLASQVGIALENALLHDELKLSFKSSILTLSATVDAKHPLTAGHSLRVTEYALVIAQKMGLEQNELDNLNYAALLHDIGKIGISDDVLLKNGPFTPAERAQMNTHPQKTKEILDKFHFPRTLRHVPQIAACHHEKVNGKGYPMGLSGDQFPLSSKIIAVADVFDALTSPRDYPKYAFGKTLDCDIMPLPKVISILKKDAGSHFDTIVVAAFLSCLLEILFHHRGGRFQPEYVDDMINAMNSSLLNK